MGTCHFWQLVLDSGEDSRNTKSRQTFPTDITNNSTFSENMTNTPLDNDPHTSTDTSAEDSTHQSHISVIGLRRAYRPDSESEAGHHPVPQTSKLITPVAFALVLVLIFYGFLLYQGLPQKWTQWSNDHDAYYEATKHSKTKPEDADKFKISSYGNQILWKRGEGEQNFRVEWAKEEFTDEFTPDKTNSHVFSETTSAKTLTVDLMKLFEHLELPEQRGTFYVRLVKLGDDTEADDAEALETSNAVQLDIKMPHPPLIMVAPFAILLLSIAFLPLIPATAHWWENNMNRLLVAGSLGFLTLLYYFFLCDFPVEQHWPTHGIVDPATNGSFAVALTVFLNAILYEFLPFIVLLFSLFVISGGIRIAGNLKGTPMVNSVILLIGALLASFIGTTGAAILLIRLLLDMNRERVYKVHTFVMFIFMVCNCGGCLTPLGDPPLFLGYLRGVPFEWTFYLWVEWMFVNMSLLAIYFVWDTALFRRKESQEFRDKCAQKTKMELSISGWMLNVPLLLGVVAAVAFLDPGKTINEALRSIPGVAMMMATLAPQLPQAWLDFYMLCTDWHPWFYMREALQLGLAATSLMFSSYLIRKANSFNFLAIGEVAALFFGIFLCMQVPLQILHHEGKGIVDKAEKTTGLSKEQLFFWSTGSLSAVLDNAPTYVVFFDTARSLTPNSEAELESIFVPALDEHGVPKKNEETGEPEMVRKWEKNDRGQWRCNDGIRKLVPLGGSTGSKGFIEHALLVAVSLGAVFCGALTYIGNGPNFMIKAIAEQDGVKMPSFFGYMGYSFMILFPLLILMTLIFLPLFP